MSALRTALPAGAAECSNCHQAVAEPEAVKGSMATDAVTSAPSSWHAPNGIIAAAGPLAPGVAFGARYHIIRLLGMGGMGAVYQAWDAELGVALALKMIRPEMTADPNAPGSRAPFQARTAAGAPGHPQERRSHPRPRRDRRRQVHHDAVHPGQRSGDVCARKGKLPVPARCASPDKSSPGCSRRTKPASFTAT